jgi:hypothetical protein
MSSYALRGPCDVLEHSADREPVAAASDNQSAVRAAGNAGKLRGCARAHCDAVRAGIDVEGKLIAGEAVTDRAARRAAVQYLP